MFGRINLVFWLLSICCGIAALYLLLGSDGKQKEIHAAYLRYVQGVKLIDELRQSSDDLTRFARAYAATGDVGYRRRFQTVLDIRNGKIPRPRDYEKAYWDFEIAGGMEYGEKGEAKSLRDRLIDNDLDANSISDLADSELLSEQLARIETDAFRSVSQGSPEHALDLLYSKEYYFIKSKIMKPIMSVQQRVEALGERHLENVAANYHSTRTMIIALTLASLLFGLLAGLFSRYSLNIAGDNGT